MQSYLKQFFPLLSRVVWSCLLCGVFLEKFYWANLVNSGCFLLPCLSVTLFLSQDSHH